VTGGENVKIGCIAETLVTRRDPVDHVVRNVIEKDGPVREAPQEIKPQIACFRGKACLHEAFPIDRSTRLRDLGQAIEARTISWIDSSLLILINAGQCAIRDH